MSNSNQIASENKLYGLSFWYTSTTIKLSNPCLSSTPTNLLKKLKTFINPFQANVPILYPLKSPENLWFSGVFKGIKWEHWPECITFHYLI